ncbi:hypothetical protein [Streptomyces odonnellii]|uniref:hypothetical protein n=1 Tax=Streptomyces odonnellii TaxID=1417980 RepID=UPI0012FEABD4|nr:hypothetical protein [Streptomyces odonnellii]
MGEVIGVVSLSGGTNGGTGSGTNGGVVAGRAAVDQAAAEDYAAVRWRNRKR